MGHILRLIQGNDPRSPSRSLPLSKIVTATSAGLYLESGGFAPGAGKLDVIWSGRTSRRDGQQRVTSSRDNAELTLRYSIKGNSMAHCARLQAKIDAFFRDCKLFEEDNEGEPVWLVYMWGEDTTSDLASLRAPAWGNFCHYIRILNGEVKAWPNTLHKVGELAAGSIISVEMSLTCAPYAESLPQYAGVGEGGLAQSIYGVETTLGDIFWQFSSELSGSAYCITGWAALVSVGTQTVFSYQSGGSDHLKLAYSGSAWVVTRAVSASYTISHSQAHSAGDRVHFAIVNTGANMIFYINGAQVGTNAIGSALPADGVFFLGKADSSESGIAFDGWRAWTVSLTAAQVLAIYNGEYPIKQEVLSDTENYSLVGPPPYWSTPNNDGTVDNPGYGILGGIGGTAEALVEWRVTPETTSVDFDTIWIGRKASSTSFDPTDTLIKFVNSSGAVGAGTDVSLFSWSISEPDKVRGRVQFLLTFSSNGQIATLTPRYRSGITYAVTGDDVTIPNSATLALYNLGDFSINWPTYDTVFMAVQPLYTIPGTSTLSRGYAVLLPYPSLKATPQNGVDANNGDVLVINPQTRQAYIQNTIAGNLQHFAELDGQVTVEPNKYNAIIFLAGTEGAAINTTNVWTVAPRVTQRWVLPGGTIA